ncbi:MAG: ABC transporter substrate-binding protein, partial [Actinomycetales bacterium]|nr:ABC transporter substrate-binding protein [Actinomycetales bacterium]
KIFSYGAELYGGKQILAIGSKAEDPERIAAFIDWLYSPEGVNSNGSQTGASAGPEGLTWDNGADGPALNDFGREVFLTGEGTVPEEWGGGSFFDGVSALNVSAVLPASENPDTGLAFSYQTWPSYAALVETPLSQAWSTKMGGAQNGIEFLTANNQLSVAPGASFTAPADSSQIEAQRNQVKAEIVQGSWQMIFAANEGEFESLWTNLQSKAKGLGYEDVLAFDMENAQAQADARAAVLAEFGG